MTESQHPHDLRVHIHNGTHVATLGLRRPPNNHCARDADNK